MTTTHDLVRTYFDHASGPDPQAYFSRFAPDAVVQDDGHTYDGIDAIRRWRAVVAPVTYEILDIDESTDASAVTTVRISGGFPGSPVTLSFRFAFDADGRVIELTIRP